jgi:hypothetical protein
VPCRSPGPQWWLAVRTAMGGVALLLLDAAAAAAVAAAAI